MTTRYGWVKWVVILGFLTVVLVVSNLVMFVVDTTEYAVVTQFGRVVQTILKPGLYWKLPEPIQTVQRYDNRMQIYEAGQVEFLTKDKKSVLTDFYGSWKIKDPLEFMKAVKDKVGAEGRLSDVFSSTLGMQFGRFDLSDLVNTNAAQMKLHDMLTQVTLECNRKAAEYGIEVVNVELRTLNFPEKNRLSVFGRMKAEREQIARKYRSEGSEEAAKLRAEAKKEEKQILSQAYKNAEILRGEGDAESIRVYAQAFQKDPEFYKFVRTLAVYDKIIDDKTTVVFPADSDLLRFLGQKQQSAAKPETSMKEKDGVK
ncbi:MAG TPA: protease modulator HflC [Lentisphaeria bacterium]|nr:MAG: HflC protein [Lentisphaerae bacterium GWF2_49_21]HBC86442.1 protease modulator HflC [Lentisphaeria bacterium]